MMKRMPAARPFRSRLAGLLLVAAAIAIAPLPAVADGGAPILILAGPVVFLVGQVWIIASELLVLRRIVPTMSWADAWRDVVAVNLRSYVLVGIALPALASIGGPALAWAIWFLLSKLGLPTPGNSIAEVIVGLSGWIPSEFFLPYGLIGWFIATFFLSVWVEGRALKRRWTKRGFAPAAAPLRISWMLNATSYVGLAAGLVWILVETAAFAPRHLQLHGPVDAWPVVLKLEPSVKVSRRFTQICILLPSDLEDRFRQGGAHPNAQAEICLDDGRCIVRVGWSYLVRREGTFYCPSGRDSLAVGRRITAVRIEGGGSLRARGVWLFSSDEI